MASLAIESAPASALPRRFLRASPLWGAVAGLMTAIDGEALFVSRWAPSTVALVHAFTLGVLGNAMLGSLSQFLPVVAGIQPRWPRLGTIWLPGFYNLGLACLLAGLLRWPALLAAAGTMLAASIIAFAVAALSGLRLDGIQTTLRVGLGLSLGFLLLTAVLGLMLTLTLAGYLTLPLLEVTDLHAMLGLLGATVLLIGCVGSVVMPMFQGTAPISSRILASWISLLALALAAALFARLLLSGSAALLLTAIPVASFGAFVLWAQWRAPRHRNPTLIGFWRVGAVALLASASAAVIAGLRPGVMPPVWLGACLIGVALPALVLGMLLEISSFLAWLDLHARRPGARGLPSVDALMPERRKLRLLRIHFTAAIALLLAAAWKGAAVNLLAGIALALAYGWTALELCRLDARARRHLSWKDVAHAT